MYYRIVMLVLFFAGSYAASLSYDLGMAWLDGGHGLNPMLAFPLCFSCFCIAVLGAREFLLSFRIVRKLLVLIKNIVRAMDDIAYESYDQAMLTSATPEEFSAEAKRLRAEKLRELHQRVKQAACNR